MSTVQAPQLLKSALKEAGQTVQACVAKMIVKPVRGDFTATLLASLNPLDSVVKGKPPYESEG